MPISWNEIRHRAIKFANDWSKAVSEAADKQTFWNEFFEVFGVARKTVASFETPVKKVSGHDGYIDLFWKGTLLVEHKSAGGKLDKAQSQAFDYIQALASEGKHNEIPRYVIVSDFARIVLYDLEPEEQNNLPLFQGRRIQIAAEFNLAEFHKNIRPFAFIAGYKQQKLDPEDPANLEATEIMADLHDALKSGGYTGHGLRQFLVRILFCLFAEDTGIFGQPRQFELFLLNHTAADGSDLGLKLARLFEVLNTPEKDRQKHLETDLAEFPYVNGELFKEQLKFADFNQDMRNALLAACAFRWEKISPAVFGSLFQDVMLPKERRQLGAHYTAEKNIIKVVRSLFLDDLHAELELIKSDKSTRRTARLEEFHAKLSKLTFFDPACGCGNFLVITYRELRALELEVLKIKFGKQQEMTLDQVNKLSLLDVDQMFGIELEEFPARIAEVALWLADHQANTDLSIAFTQRYIRIPLRKSPHIHVGNALRLPWKDVIAPERCSYILGNPPFVGAKYMSDEQRNDMALVTGDVENYGLLDYVTAWYFLAAQFVKGTRIVVAFVSTNSISQGEQAGTLWNPLFADYKLKIHFAHRTFEWESEARGKAHVHCVIIGFAAVDASEKTIFDYETDPQHPTISKVKNISPYLVEGADQAITNRGKPLSAIPEIGIGNKPIDNGNYLFTPEQKADFLRVEPKAGKYFVRWVGSVEFINNIERWCLWLGDCSPDELRQMPHAVERVEAVRRFREASKSAPTRKLAKTPRRFHVENFPKSNYLLIPKVSSERRRYIPMGFMGPDTFASDLCFVLQDATLYHFGILSSLMHMAWLRHIGGRLKSDYRYSAKLVYNNFPWPQSLPPELRVAVEQAARAVLDVRSAYPNSTLADLYDPIAMPSNLAQAHGILDQVVDRCYRKSKFENDRQRVEFLFQLYQEISAPLLPKISRARPKRESKPVTQAKKSTIDSTERSPSTWYVDAIVEMSAGLIMDGTEKIFEHLSDRIAKSEFKECERELAAVLRLKEHGALDALLTVLTVTQQAAEYLPSRQKLRDLVRARLISIGKNPDEVLVNL